MNNEQFDNSTRYDALRRDANRTLCVPTCFPGKVRDEIPLARIFHANLNKLT